jgi:Fe2+ or Zn2+ uptake regulation protein
VLAVLRRGIPVSAQDVHAALRGTPAQLGLSTAYRELRTLALEGVVDVARVADETMYTIGGTQVTDLLVCSLCARTSRSPRDPRLTELLTTQGVLDVDHRSVVIQGRCLDCTV